MTSLCATRGLVFSWVICLGLFWIDSFVLEFEEDFGSDFLGDHLPLKGDLVSESGRCDDGICVMFAAFYFDLGDVIWEEIGENDLEILAFFGGLNIIIKIVFFEGFFEEIGELYEV